MGQLGIIRLAAGGERRRCCKENPDHGSFAMMWNVRRMQGRQAIRVLLLILAYGVHVAVSVVAIDPITQWTDAALPGWFFYHLEPDEDAGPIGNVTKFLFMLGLPFIIYAALFVPIARLMEVPRWALVLLAIINEPIVEWLFMRTQR